MSYKVTFTIPSMTGDKRYNLIVDELDEWANILVNGGLFDVHIHLEEQMPLYVTAYPIYVGNDGMEHTNVDVAINTAIIEVSSDDMSDLCVVNDRYYYADSNFEAPICRVCGFIASQSELQEQMVDGCCKECKETLAFTAE